MPNEKTGATIAVTARLQPSAHHKDRPALAAWAFSQGGRFLAKAPLDGEGRAELRVPAVATATAVRVMVGPEREEGREGASADLADLVRVGAVDSHLRIEPETRRLSAELQLLAPVWIPLAGGPVLRAGVLNKGYSDGVELPVCHAVVEIWEVEPWWLIIPRIPIDILNRLRQIVAGQVPPIHIPGPGPVEDVRPLTLAQAAVAGGPVPVRRPRPCRWRSAASRAWRSRPPTRRSAPPCWTTRSPSGRSYAGCGPSSSPCTCWARWPPTSAAISSSASSRASASPAPPTSTSRPRCRSSSGRLHLRLRARAGGLPHLVELSVRLAGHPRHHQPLGLRLPALPAGDRA